MLRSVPLTASLKIIYLRALILRNSCSSRHKIHVTKLLIFFFFLVLVHYGILFLFLST